MVRQAALNTAVAAKMAWKMVGRIGASLSWVGGVSMSVNRFTTHRATDGHPRLSQDESFSISTHADRICRLFSYSLVSTLSDSTHHLVRSMIVRSICVIVATGLLGVLVAETAVKRNTVSQQAQGAHYLRVSIARWNVDTYSPEAERMFDEIETGGVAVFRAQPGFVRYRLMRENKTTTVAVAEWESEALGLAGAEQYRGWMRDVGIMDHITLETHTGQIVATSN